MACQRLSYSETQFRQRSTVQLKRFKMLLKRSSFIGGARMQTAQTLDSFEDVDCRTTSATISADRFRVLTTTRWTASDVTS